MAEICASAAPISTKNTSVEELRRSVTYHPSVWRDHFLSYTNDVTEITAAEKEELEKQKEKVKNLLDQTPNDSTLKIELIDAIQRLGFGYHFEEVIDESLGEVYDRYEMPSGKDDEDEIRVRSLRFRLLRQQGYRVPCDVFEKLLDDKGNFKDSLITDVEGLLSLYEASNYGINGEEIMDKALKFSSSHLEGSIHKMPTSLSRRVKEALDMPISKTLTRLGARKFISLYQEDESHNELLLKFAKLDFNIVQKMHQRELHHITRWWEGLEFGKKLPFARDRVVECFFWILGVYFEPKYEIARRFLTKVISMTSILDDIYDVYGSLDELRRLTHAIQRWDISVGDELPPYMRICYEALLGVYSEMEDEMAKKGQSYRLLYARQEMIKLVMAYMVEAEWCFSKYFPTMEEYMKQALVSGAYMMLSTTSLVGMEDLNITKHDFDWITSEPPMLRAASVICRLMDDMVGHGIEQKIISVDCYMRENGCSKEEACREFWNRVKKAWKCMNEECLEPRAASMAILARVLNLARVINLLYVGEDAYGSSSTKTKNFIKSVLVDPIHSIEYHI
uniref:(-)-germacrene D synthase n=1 Tax=Origanum vulgare TaxID=39352 RepID=GCDS_ORIVU|nr:RecName: Full=(-)-germacrene D synthase; AltName: Full=Terpene synthase 3; Short=OvTPS3 [Origanum vulgare]ADK73619.1 terpene synthase 3 [Origanum vulgare]